MCKFMSIEISDEAKAIKEIIDYVEDKPGTSYYDIKELAYSTGNEAWIKALQGKSSRQCIALYLKDKRKTDRVPYNRDYMESYISALEARARYRDEQENQRYDAMEETIEIVSKKNIGDI